MSTTAFVKFYALGLPFEAEVLYSAEEEAITTGPADAWYAGCGADVDEVVSLTCNGNDAMFLLDSMDESLYHDLMEAVRKVL